MLHGVVAPSEQPNAFSGTRQIENSWVSICERCQGVTIWVDGKLAFPDVVGGPPPNSDLPEGIQDDFEEARSIVDRSPRGAAALLRLCIQKTCEHLGEPGEYINADIGNLVKKGLPMQVQQALDVVRVTGNNAVHPGQMNLKDDRDTAMQLFGLVNLIADIMITQPNQVARMYDSLPQTAKAQIAKRDQKKP